MPRPGPRPYECVRRAWHSDRHQPMRGSIIQQIFRVVTEGHSSATRKNREWQEKLPRVVLKAEEIMYSKANSEAEYMNPDTLWERLNDAIDTIIRRDKSTETGQFLQPCIEAALVLGCVPVRASRSQRHSNPRSYLNPRFQESAQAAPLSTDRTNDHRPPPQPPTPSGNQLAVSRSTMANQACSTSPFNTQTVKNSSYISPHGVTHLQPSFPRPITSMAVESNTPLNFGSVYPLYYGSHCHNTEFQYGFRSPQNPSHNSIIIGTPVGWPAGQSSRFANTRNLLPDESTVMGSDKLRQVEPVDHHGNVAEKACDLSLRLGPLDPCTSVGDGLAYVTEESGSSSHRESGKHPCDKNHEFCFFPRHDAGSIPFEPSNNRLEPEGEFQDPNATLRKRKAPDPQELEDGCTQWLTKVQPDPFGGQSRWPGSLSNLQQYYSLNNMIK